MKRFVVALAVGLVLFGGCTGVPPETDPPTVESPSAVPTYLPWPASEASPQLLDAVDSPITDPRCERPEPSQLGILKGAFGGNDFPDAAIRVVAFTRDSGTRWIIAARKGEEIRFWASALNGDTIGFPDEDGHLLWTDEEKVSGQVAAEIAASCLGY